MDALEWLNENLQKLEDKTVDELKAANDATQFLADTWIANSEKLKLQRTRARWTALR